MNTVARVLRPAGLLSSGGRGPGGADMTIDDKINLLLGTCGVEVANRAAEYVRVWRRSFRADTEKYPRLKFAFLDADNVRDLLVNLITVDLNGGALSDWLKQADNARAKKLKLPKVTNHTITLDFHVDAFALELIVSRHEFQIDIGLPKKVATVTTHPITVRFAPPPPPLDVPLPPRMSQQYIASTDLIRRLHENNLVGWGACLLE